MTTTQPATLPLGRSFQPLGRLKLADWNPRIITEPAFKALLESLKQRPAFMLRRPLLVADGPQHHAGGIVHGGNMRTRALQQLFKDGWQVPEDLQDLGWKPGTAPVDVDDISIDEAKAQALIDNNSWGNWQEDELAELVHGLGEAGFQLDLLGFDDQQLAGLLESVGVGPDRPGAQLPSPRNLGIDAIVTINRESDAGCCLAVKSGFRYGFQSGNHYCPRARHVQGNHKIAFIDNNYEHYDHAVHAAAVKEHKPKYATVRDVMTKQQCAAAGIPYFPLEQILEWAEQLREDAQHVIVIPKYDCFDQIPEHFMLGYSVPSSHGATPLSHEVFAGRRVHLLGGSWKMQLGYLAVLGADVVSLDNNYVHKIANYGQFTTQDGELRNVSELGLGHLNNPRYVAMALSFGLVSAKLNELYPATAKAEDDAGVQEVPEAEEEAENAEVAEALA